MKTPSREDIARRAYYIWEQRGRPSDRNSEVECWLQAERELKEATPTPFSPSRDGDSDHIRGQARIVEITNLDRALPPQERRRARTSRKEPPPKSASSNQDEKLLVVLNRAHLRIYIKARNKSTPQLVHALDMPDGHRGYTDNDTDQAGRFPGSHGTSPGGSIDERLPMQEEQQRRAVKKAAEIIEELLQQHPDSKWCFSAGPTLHNAVLDELSDETCDRLETALVKDLVGIRAAELPQHFDS